MFKLILFTTFISLFSTVISAQTQQTQKSLSNTNNTAKKQSENKDKKEKELVEGTAKLRVTFMADGTVGDVIVLDATPSIEALEKAGLIEQAVAAAKKIKFIPPKRNGKPYPVKKIIEYKFTIY